MPTYEYRCNNCGRDVRLFYKTYRAYDEATHTCPHCKSEDLTRLISRVAISAPSRDYSKMSEDEMLAVMEGGDARELGNMMQQLGQDEPDLGAEFHEAAERLAKGESAESVERDLQAQGGGDSSVTDD